MSELNKKSASDIEPYSSAAMLDFCNGYNWMFEKNFRCTSLPTRRMSPIDLCTEFVGIIAVNHVEYVGVGTGSFMIIFDKSALFSLGGTTVMFPAPRIKEDCRKGTVEDAVGLSDAVGEIGNLMMGSFNKVFRDGVPNLEGLGSDVQLHLQLPISVGTVELGLDPAAAAYNVFTYQFELAGLDPFCLRVAFPEIAS